MIAVLSASQSRPVGKDPVTRRVHEMKVLLLAHGSRGDVQPFIALARGLTEAGHEAVVGAPKKLSGLTGSHDVTLRPLEDRIVKFVSNSRIRCITQNNFHGIRGKLQRIQYLLSVRRMMDEVMRDMATVADPDADVVVHLVQHPAHEIAEALGVPAVPVCLQPGLVPTRLSPSPVFSKRIPRILNRASYLPTEVARLIQQGNTYRWRRKTLGLSRRRGHSDPLRRPDGSRPKVLQAFSRHVLSAETNYPDWVNTTGYWLLPTPGNWSPPPELTRFLLDGEPPIYVGFGSISGPDPHRTVEIVLEAVRRVGVRAVVATGWGGIAVGRPQRGVCYVEEVPHDWLFARSSAIVHHGGAGTTGAALASGRPQVVCPFMGDQVFYARRMYDLGVSPQPQPQRRLHPEGLANAIQEAVQRSSLSATAEKIGHEIRAENGVAKAVQEIESLVLR